jgi:hypothetical protein
MIKGRLDGLIMGIEVDQGDGISERRSFSRWTLARLV